MTDIINSTNTNSWNTPSAMPKDGDIIIAHCFCKFVVGWFVDHKDGVEYDEYVATYEADDENDKPESRDDYEFHRYGVQPMYSSCGSANWEDVIEWLPLPEVK